MLPRPVRLTRRPQVSTPGAVPAPMRPALALLVTAAALGAPAAASANALDPRTGLQAPMIAAPLEGEGENMKLIGNVEVEGTTELELAGDHAFLAADAGLTLVNIKDPRAPFIEAVAECAAGYGDVDVNPTATVAALGTDSGNPDCVDGNESGTVLFDISDKKAPKFAGFVPVSVGSHTQTLDGRGFLYINNYDPNYRIIEIYDVSDPRNPRKVSQVDMNGTAAHDSYVDHRPDGKSLLYSASVSSHDVVDVTDPAKPLFLQKVRDNQVSISHQSEPNFKRDVIVVTDEYGGGAASGVCGKSPTADPTGLGGGYVTGAQSVGAVHFYKAAADGTYSLNGAEKLGTFNIPPSVQEGGCTSHVYWQAPDQNRMTIAWYLRGSHIVDFSDPAASKELGWFIPEGANTWGTKPHRGYVFASDMARGLDVFEYTGEGGKAWPATSEPAEVTRLRRIGASVDTSGAKPVPAPSGSQTGSRRLGTFSMRTRTKRVPGRRGKKRKTLTFTVTDRSNLVVAKLRFKKPAGRRARVRARGTAVAGTYRYVIRAGDRGKVLKRGRLKVRARAGARLAPNLTLICRVR